MRKPRLYAIYDEEGQLLFTTKTQKDIRDKFGVSYSTISRAIQQGWKIRGHAILAFEPNGKAPESIEVEKYIPRFLDEGGRPKRMYLVYHLDGRIAVEKPMFMNEVTEYLNVTKHTILDGIIKKHLCNKHIVKLAKSRDKFPKRLSPLTPEFKVYQYNREGDLVGWYTTMSVTERLTGIPYDTIRNCVVKGFSTHPEYFFTDHLPMSGYKKRRVKFKEKRVPIKVLVSKGVELNNVPMSLSKACTFIGTSYSTLKKKIEESPRIIFKGCVIERVE